VGVHDGLFFFRNSGRPGTLARHGYDWLRHGYGCAWELFCQQLAPRHGYGDFTDLSVGRHICTHAPGTGTGVCVTGTGVK